ncbi:MAG: type II toxin-antitoxin system VapC family toxin [Gemmatimonadaceae bacterium]
MRYWDASALIPLIVAETTSARLEDLMREDPAAVTWCGSAIECTSALARLERDGALGAADVRAAIERLRQAMLGWIEVPASTDVRDQAMRLLRVHKLRAADAIQIAAAIVAADYHASALEFVTLDGRQGEVAEREGFRVLD